MKATYNVDWVECYCVEQDFFGTPDYYRNLGYIVKEHDYGTRMYKQVFDVFAPNNRPLYHITRDPYSVRGREKGGIFPIGACHIKVQNNLLYNDDWCVELLAFLIDNHYEFKCISRIDLCCDLQQFADGTLPKTLVAGYFAGKYHKVNQPNFTAHGVDNEYGLKIYNSVSWGSKNSSVSSIIYNKSKELKEVKDKPYIRDQWTQAGFDPKKTTWRIELKIKSDGRRLLNKESGEIQELRLTDFDTKSKVKAQFLKYAQHYFRWKNAKNGVKKKNCNDKKLFDDLPLDNWAPYRSLGEDGAKRSDRIAVGYLQTFRERAVSFSGEEQEALNKAISIILQHKRLVKWFRKKYTGYYVE